MNCPNCGTQNDPRNRFCLKCGTQLATAGQPEATPPPSGPSTMPQTGPSSGWSHSSQGAVPHDSFPLADHLRKSRGASWHSQDGYPHPGDYGGGATAFLNIWGPFAGYGTRKRHVGWLLDEEGHRTPELIEKIEERFRKREIPGAGLFKRSLIARGVIVEMRPYFLVRHGLATLALYVSQFGRDLFISQASYLKPPISNFRALVFGAMVVLQVLTTCILPTALVDAASNDLDALGSGLATLLCVLSPVAVLNFVVLPLVFLFGLYKWVKEKDFWAFLRTPPNEFNEDDLMAMEKAVEETVRQSLTELKLDPESLKMVVVGDRGQLF